MNRRKMIRLIDKPTIQAVTLSFLLKMIEEKIKTYYEDKKHSTRTEHDDSDWMESSTKVFTTCRPIFVFDSGCKISSKAYLESQLDDPNSETSATSLKVHILNLNVKVPRQDVTNYYFKWCL